MVGLGAHSPKGCRSLPRNATLKKAQKKAVKKMSKKSASKKKRPE